MEKRPTFLKVLNDDHGVILMKANIAWTSKYRFWIGVPVKAVLLVLWGLHIARCVLEYRLLI